MIDHIRYPRPRRAPLRRRTHRHRHRSRHCHADAHRRRDDHGTCGRVTVFAAASLKDTFSEIGRLFEANHTGTKVVFNFDGSQVLRTQLQQGAYADVFASANTQQMNLSKGDGKILNDTVKLGAQPDRPLRRPPPTRRDYGSQGFRPTRVSKSSSERPRCPSAVTPAS